MIVSGVQHSDSVIHIYIFFFIFFSIMVYYRKDSLSFEFRHTHTHTQAHAIYNCVPYNYILFSSTATAVYITI